MLAVVEGERGGLIDRNGARVSGGIGIVSGVKARVLNPNARSRSLMGMNNQYMELRPERVASQGVMTVFPASCFRAVLMASLA